MMKLLAVCILTTIFSCSFGLKTYIISDEPANFYQAFLNCKQDQMRLATVTSAEENVYIKSLLQDIQIGLSDGFWLSGSNMQNTNKEQFYWYSTGAPVIYTDWLPGQPDDASGQEHCLQLVKLSEENGVGWNDYTCNLTTKYVCEILE